MASRLPIFGLSDGDQITTSDGNLWEYNAETNDWLLRGKFDDIPEVSEDEDGLVTPEIYRKLILIRELMDRGVKFDVFKLDSSVPNPYFFYFSSSDRLIRFQPEGNGKLRLEIDRARLHAMLVSQCCIGPKGRKGKQGRSGIDGIPAKAEVFASPVRPVGDDIIITGVDGEKIVIPDATDNSHIYIVSQTVESPIETPISLRIYDESKEEVAEFLIPIDGSDVTYSLVSGVEIESTGVSLQYEPSLEKLVAVIPFSSGVGSDGVASWTHKARQVGPQGDTGADGKDYLEVEQRLIEDNSLESTTAVVSLRKGGTTDLRTLSAEMHTDICVSRLSAVEGRLPPTDLLRSNLVAAEITTRDCKYIGRFDMSENFVNVIDGIEAPDLDLPSWKPAPGCGQQSRYQNFRFNWWDRLDEDVRYMFRIVPTPKPPDQCCEHDFWWCPNIGDLPCGVTNADGSDVPQLELPRRYQDECECECENPIDLELQSGGFVFAPLDATTDEFSQGALTASSVFSVLDGSPDKFTVDVIVESKVRVYVKIDPNPDLCGGEKNQRKQCGYREVRRIHTSAVLEDLSGNAVFNTPQVVEAEAYPASLDFAVDTSTYKDVDGDEQNTTTRLRMVVSVNNTQIDACQGYRITVGVQKDGAS